MRTITRTWKRKDGTIVRKTYEYKHKSTRGATLVNKRGKINKQNVNDYINAINNNKNLTANQKRNIINHLKIEIKDRHDNHKALTTNGFEGIRRNFGHKINEYEQRFANAGYDIDDVAQDLGIPTQALMNPKNWNGSEFSYNGKT